MSRLLCLLPTAYCLLCAAAAAAGPSDKDPQALFDVRPEPELIAWRADAAKHYEAALKTLDEFAGLAAAPKWVVVRAKLGQAHLELLRAERVALRLAFWGEPAGADLGMRIELAHNRLGTLVEKLRILPDIKNGSTDEFHNLRLVIGRIPKASFAKVMNFEKAGKWEEADAALFDMRAPLEPTIIWQSYALVEADMRPFDQEQRKIRAQLDAQWRTAAAAKLATLAKAATPDFAALAAQIAAAVESVRATGQATVNGKSFSAPQALWELTVAARQVQAAAVRARALDWARLGLDEQAHADIAQLEAGDAQLLQTLLQKFPALIEADAARLQPADAAQCYAEWVAAAALVLSETAGSAENYAADLRAALAAALDHLAARTPDLQTSVAQYRQATGELLRWRERTVASYLRLHAGESQPLEKRFLAGAGKSDKSRGLIPANGSGSDIVMLIDSAPQTVPNLAQQTIATATVVHRVQAALGPGGAPAGPLASAYRARLYVELPAALDARTAVSSTAVTALGNELAPGGSYPLTLEAAEALAAAARGQYDSVGGKLTGVELQGLMPRFAAADAQDPLVRLEPLPKEAIGKSELELVVRFTLDPAWSATRYFIVTRQ